MAQRPLLILNVSDLEQEQAVTRWLWLPLLGKPQTIILSHIASHYQRSPFGNCCLITYGVLLWLDMHASAHGGLRNDESKSSRWWAGQSHLAALEAVTGCITGCILSKASPFWSLTSVDRLFLHQDCFSARPLELCFLCRNTGPA